MRDISFVRPAASRFGPSPRRTPHQRNTTTEPQEPPSGAGTGPHDPVPLDRLLAALHLTSFVRRWRESLGVALLLFLLTLAVYHWSNQGKGAAFNQYSLLADAFLDGRLDLLNPPAFLEMAVWQGR